MLAAAGAAALAIWLTTSWLLDVADDAPPGPDRAKIRVDAVRTGLAAGAGAGAAVGLMLAFRRQRHAELATALGQLDAAERRITELYNAAAEQLGSDKAPVRLTALYTLERLANDNERHRQTIVNIICAYLRMPYTPPPTNLPEEEHRDRTRRAAARYHAARDNSPPPAQPTPHTPDPREEHQVRLTAQRLLTTHLQRTNQHHWSNISLDLTGATLINFNLANCAVHDANFSRATFSGIAWFEAATFSGTALFSDATFSGNAWFRDATFSGDTWFGAAIFSETAWFGAATFSETALFGDATFSGDASFGDATFSGNAWFRDATFSGNAWFGAARFEAGIDMTSATVADAAGAHEPPPGWQIEPTEGGAGRFGRIPAPPNGS
ncbi:pentapeptide repeat-containing protein [Actinomadura rayongensis]|uniref:Pentapeptide repeat-containing protein n=1 Tax=Actinomadura rayongensis TaxID=1429076 RepID=A0A6I4W578_9ACTN|nr:pentapeptide repeat-containing protein [Actinomadura rayongensis]MXQ64453.1 pentapeptide repeat-containing protein [Actinomadura rayongensis]